MKMIRFCLLMALLVSMPGFARANGIHAVIVDPPFDGYSLGVGESSVPSAYFVFHACNSYESGLLASPDLVGCFDIQNETGATLTGFTMTFKGAISIFGDSPVCGGLFSSTSCTETATADPSVGFYDLDFSDGTVLNGSTIIIGESVDVADFNDVHSSLTNQASLATTTTPEPASVALLGTGIIAGAGLMFVRRRGLHFGSSHV